MHKSAPINTAKDFINALKKYQVREVSSNLFLNFPAGSYLYPDQYTLGWIGTNHNLFQLLVLNQRYKSKSKQKGDGFQVSAKAFSGLFRAIGFGAKSDSSFGSFNVYERNSKADAVPTTSTGVKKPYASDMQFPIFSGFEQNFEKDLFLYSGLSKDRVVEISKHLENVWNSMRQDVFANSWTKGPNGTMFLQYLGAKTDTKLSAQQAHNLAAITPDNTKTGIGRFKHNSADSFVKNVLGKKDSNPDNFYQADGKKTYAWWRKLANDYGTMLFADKPQSIFFQGQPPTAPAGAQSFSNLIQDLSDKYAAEPGSTYKRFGPIESVLQATLRFYILFNYQASPLNTQNSLPYSDSANPFIPGSFKELNNLKFKSTVKAPHSWREIFGPTWMDTFSGNEVWLDNLEVDSLTSKPISGADDKKVYTGDKNVYDNGWLHSSDLTFTKITTSTNGKIKGQFGKIYYLEDDASQSTRAVRFSDNTNSSDIFSAYAVKGDLKDLNQNSKIGRTGQRIGDYAGLVHSEKILPNQFKTYTFLGGGVDRITGSDFADVIVGTTRQANGTVTPGSLTVFAANGNDVVAPGRGSGIISLGEGKDQLVIDLHDTHGRTTLFDFNFEEDSLVLHKKLNTSIDINNDQILYIFNHHDNEFNEIKTLHLTQSSGTTTEHGWTDFFNNHANPAMQDALIPQPVGLV